MAEAAATESFAPLPDRFFGTGFVKGGRGRRLHILHSGAAASRPGTFAQRKLDGRAGAPRRIDRIKRIRLPKVKSAWGVCRAKCSTLPRHPGGIALRQRCRPIYGLARASGQSKKAVCFGAHCFLSSFQFSHDLLERVPKGGGPRKRGVAGNLHQIAALLQSYGAPLSKKGKKAAVRWARRQGSYFCGFRTRLTIRPGTTISLTTSMPSK